MKANAAKTPLGKKSNFFTKKFSVKNNGKVKIFSFIKQYKYSCVYPSEVLFQIYIVGYSFIYQTEQINNLKFIKKDFRKFTIQAIQ